MDKINQPCISVCIPVFNCEAYIGFTIESVLNQTLKDFELIILDNKSTDRTLNIIRKFKDSRIRLIENETNIGAEGNWNRALIEARGKYIKILCADDLLYPNCLELQLAIFETPSNEGIALVCSGRDIINDRGSKIFSRNFKGEKGRLPGAYAIKKSIQAGTNLIGEPTAVLIKAEVIDKAGQFDISIPYVIDLDLWCRILLQGDLYIIPEALCVFRVSSASWSVNIARSQSEDFQKFISRLEEDPRYNLGYFDKVLGRHMAILNKLLRNLFYKVILRVK
ncbi:MAG: glycosyltransferase [Carboxydocellales bacterium]